jgi:hypothetical protein
VSCKKGGRAKEAVDKGEEDVQKPIKTEGNDEQKPNQKSDMVWLCLYLAWVRKLSSLGDPNAGW